MSPKGNSLISGRRDHLYDPKGNRVISCCRDLSYDPEGHGALCGRFDLVYDHKRSQLESLDVALTYFMTP